MNTNINIEINDYKIIGIKKIPNKGLSLYLTPIENDKTKINNDLLNLIIVDGTLENDFLMVFLKNGTHGETRLKWLGSELKVAFVGYKPIALIINNSNICILENHYVDYLHDVVGYSNREYLNNVFGLDIDNLVDLIKEELPKIYRK